MVKKKGEDVNGSQIDRSRISNNSTGRSRSRSRIDICSVDSRDLKKSIAKKRTIQHRNSRICTNRSLGFICLNDGINISICILR
jgi:hypothetical protein